MKLSREKKVVYIAALSGLILGLRLVLFLEQLNDLAGAISAKPEPELPSLLRRRYVPTVEREKAI